MRKTRQRLDVQNGLSASCPPRKLATGLSFKGLERIKTLTNITARNYVLPTHSQIILLNATNGNFSATSTISAASAEGGSRMKRLTAVSAVVMLAFSVLSWGQSSTSS